MTLMMKEYSVQGKRSNKRFVDKMTFIMALTSTMPIVGIPIAGRYISLFTICFVVFLVEIACICANSRKTSIVIDKSRKIYLLFLIWPIISYVVGLLYMPERWYSSMTSYAIRVIEFIVVTLLLYLINDERMPKSFAKGLLFGIVVNAIWSIIEAISYFFVRRSLNDLIFGRYLSLDRSILIWNSLGGIRASGLNYDPAHLGGLLPILFFYALIKRNYYLLALSLISLAFSQSTTAIVGVIVCLIAYAVFFSNKTGKAHRKVSGKGMIVAFAVVVFAGLIIMTNSTQVTKFASSVSENVSGYISRINSVYVTNSTAGQREIYYTKAFDRLIDRNPVVALTGSGLGTSMYPYRIFSGLFESGAENAVTEIETNYIAYLFDLGVIGLGLYLVFLFSSTRKMITFVKKNKDVYAVVFLGTLISVICCSAFYHYIFTAYQMLAFSFLTVSIDNLEWNNK